MDTIAPHSPQKKRFNLRMKSFSLDSPDSPSVSIQQPNLVVPVAAGYYSHHSSELHGSSNWFPSQTHQVQHPSELVKSLDIRQPQQQQQRESMYDQRGLFDDGGPSFLYQDQQYLPDMPALYQHRHSYHSHQPPLVGGAPSASSSYVQQHQLSGFGLHPQHHQHSHHSSHNSHDALNSSQHLNALQAAAVQQLHQSTSDQNEPVQQQLTPTSVQTSSTVPTSAGGGPKSASKHRGSNEHVKTSQPNECCKFLTLFQLRPRVHLDRTQPAHPLFIIHRKTDSARSHVLSSMFSSNVRL